MNEGKSKNRMENMKVDSVFISIENIQDLKSLLFNKQRKDKYQSDIEEPFKIINNAPLEASLEEGIYNIIQNC